MGQWIDLQAADGTPFSAWAAHPPGALRGAVIVGQEIFGVNSHIRAVTDRMATRGFLAIAPDLFARFTPRLDLGYSEADVAQGRRYKAQAEAMPDAILQQVQASAQWALAQAPCKVGMVGFCWGGLVTWRAAVQVPELSAAVTYYGGGMTSQRERTRRPRCPVQAHFGRRDTIIPLQEVLAFAHATQSQAAHQPPVQTHIYEAEHGFNCDLRASYDHDSAIQAKDRTLLFFDQHLALPLP